MRQKFGRVGYPMSQPDNRPNFFHHKMYLRSIVFTTLIDLILFDDVKTKCYRQIPGMPFLLLNTISKNLFIRSTIHFYHFFIVIIFSH